MIQIRLATSPFTLLGQRVEVVLVHVERMQFPAEPDRGREGAQEVLAGHQLLQVGQPPNRRRERLLRWNNYQSNIVT